MFDTLVVSEPKGTRVRSRRNYFMLSGLTVAVLVFTAVVASIFAEEISLGTDNFELSVLVMPVEQPPTQPERPRPAKPAAQTPTASASQVPTRRIPMASVTEPTIAPKDVSTAPNTQLSRPLDSRFEIGPRDTNPPGSGNSRVAATGDGDGEPSGLGTGQPVAQALDPEPPPVKKPAPPKNPPTQSRGVVNGLAISLPKPAYPPTALAVNAQGKVNVQVLIDESGRVISAKATGGHPLLRDAAENAARNARFSPTKLSDVPVKVTGVIVYNFTRG